MRLIFIIVFAISALFAKSNIDVNSSIKAIYWEVTKDNKRFFLFGTMHIRDKRVELLMSPIKSLINRVDGVYTEIKINPITKYLVFQKSLRDDKKSLKEILPKDIYDSLDSYLKSIHPLYSAKMFDRFKIWVIALSLELLKEDLKNKGLKSVDEQIYNLALFAKKEVNGIESIDEQVSLFDDKPISWQIDLLRESLNQVKKYPNMTYKLKELYFRGDTQQVLKLFKKLEKESKLKDLTEKILYNRNSKMAKRVIKIVNKNPNKSYLFAFGLMHFLGEGSIIELLKKDGFSVKQKEVLIK